LPSARASEPLSTREKGTLIGGGAGGVAAGYAIGNEKQNQEEQRQQNANY
jgi:hypothetical protein